MGDVGLLTAGSTGAVKGAAKAAKAGDKAKNAAENAAKQTPQVATETITTGTGKNLSQTKIETGKQNKHIEGTNEYKTAGGNRSILTADPNSLTSKFGTGQQIGKIPVGQPGSKERIDFGRYIGYYIKEDGTNKTPTTIGTVHYSKNGAHIVPARPKSN